MNQAINISIPSDASSEMVVATRPNEIDISKSDTSGYKTHIESRTFLTDRIEYLVEVGNQIVKVQTPHRIRFEKNEECYVKFISPMWYPADDEKEAAERAKRQVI